MQQPYGKGERRTVRGMHASASPEEVFHRLIDGVAAQRGEELAELYAPHAVVEHPLDPAGAPPLRGRKALREHFKTDDEGPSVPRLRPADIVVHQTTDPEVIVAEFAYEVLDGDGDVPQRLPCIFVLRVRDGLIVTSRDYAPPPPLGLG
jgi:ketosteroid isomerase-like protein